jgi:hypothetical protein
MGVEYERWLIARGSVFQPSAAAVAKLVQRLRAESWIPQGGHAVRTVENDFGDDLAAQAKACTERQPPAITAEWLDDPDREELRLVWHVEADPSSAIHYPLAPRPHGRVTYDLELHRCHEYVYPVSESIDAVPTTCACGEDLGFHWDEDEVVPAFGDSSGIFAECEACSRTFDPSSGAATVRNPFDGSSEQVRGGAAYRFALKVACGTCFVKDPALAFAPALVALLEDEFGRSFWQFGSLSLQSTA